MKALMSFSNCLAGCSKIPEVENAEVSESSKKDNYTDGDKLEYSCKTGYASLLKITFNCTNNKWTKLRNGKCSRGYTRHSKFQIHLLSCNFIGLIN